MADEAAVAEPAARYERRGGADLEPLGSGQPLESGFAERRQPTRRGR